MYKQTERQTDYCPCCTCTPKIVNGNSVFSIAWKASTAASVETCTMTMAVHQRGVQYLWSHLWIVKLTEITLDTLGRNIFHYICAFLEQDFSCHFLALTIILAIVSK